MDFKSLLNKLDSMEPPVATPAAPKLPQAVQLNEDAQLRVLSGATTYIAEAKKKAEEEKVDEASEKTDKPWTDMKGNKHPGTSVKGDKYQGKEAESDEKQAKKKDESIDPKFKSTFMKMVEAKKDEKKKSKKEKMDEASKPDANKDGIPDYAQDGKGAKDLGKGKKPAAKDGEKKDGKKGMSAAQEKYFGKKNESVKTSKKVVAESVETKLSFKEMMKLVVESGGQQSIDPLDKDLFAWATRVAQSKFNEGMKAEVYAGMVYERMGGAFEMYDVLSESKK